MESTTSQVCNDVLVKKVHKDELLKLWQSPDIPPQRRQFSFHESCYNDPHLQQVRKRAIRHWFGYRHVEYSTLHARLNSLKDRRPEGKLPTPEAFSTAGFFYDGEFTLNFDYAYIIELHCRTFISLSLAGCMDGTICHHCGVVYFSGFPLTSLGSNMHASSLTSCTSHMSQDLTLFGKVSKGSLTMTWRRKGRLAKTWSYSELMYTLK
jgi:hypothetical protein